MKFHTHVSALALCAAFATFPLTVNASEPAAEAKVEVDGATTSQSATATVTTETQLVVDEKLVGRTVYDAETGEELGTIAFIDTETDPRDIRIQLGESRQLYNADEFLITGDKLIVSDAGNLEVIVTPEMRGTTSAKAEVSTDSGTGEMSAEASAGDATAEVSTSDDGSDVEATASVDADAPDAVIVDQQTSSIDVDGDTTASTRTVTTETTTLSMESTGSIESDDEGTLAATLDGKEENGLSLLSEDELIGQNVYAIDGDKVGEIRGIVDNNGDKELIIRHGGLFKDETALKMDQLLVVDDRIVVSMSEDEFEKLVND